MTSTADRRIDVFLARATAWAPEMAELRRIMLTHPLTETLKWRQPCYKTAQGNIGIVSCLKSAATINFFRGALLRDPSNLLVVPGPHSRSARFMKFTSVAQITAQEPHIHDFIAQAILLAETGQKVDMTQNRQVDIPPELDEAFAADPDFAQAFQALTPGRQRGYLIHFAGAKQSETRNRRIEKHRDRILDGLGMHDR